MNENPSCPVCGFSQAWETFGFAEFRRTAPGEVSPYVDSRLDVLFDIWAPGTEEIRLSWVMCSGCGFVAYLPRPSREDISAKYERLGTTRQDRDEEHDNENARRRGMLILKFLGRRAPRAQRRVLDFGGGDGALMGPLADRGMHCFLLDYGIRSAPCVTRIGRTVSDLSEDDSYDLIVASHVLEHLADPLQSLVDLRRHVSPTGVMYVEVPLEVWRGPPRMDEPVTHVNFFTPDSLALLAERAGFVVLKCKLGEIPHLSGHTMRVIRLVGTPGYVENVRTAARSAEATRRLLNPGLWTRLRVAVQTPGRVARAVGRRTPWRTSCD